MGIVGHPDNPQIRKCAEENCELIGRQASSDADAPQISPHLQINKATALFGNHFLLVGVYSSVDTGQSGNTIKSSVSTESP
jgi:hypothetical protein